MAYDADIAPWFKINFSDCYKTWGELPSAKTMASENVTYTWVILSLYLHIDCHTEISHAAETSSLPMASAESILKWKDFITNDWNKKRKGITWL